MKAELRLQKHTRLPDTNAVEIWYAGKMVATIYGADGPGARIISKSELILESLFGGKSDLMNCVEIRVKS